MQTYYFYRRNILNKRTKKVIGQEICPSPFRSLLVVPSQPHSHYEYLDKVALELTEAEWLRINNALKAYLGDKNDGWYLLSDNRTLEDLLKYFKIKGF